MTTTATHPETDQLAHLPALSQALVRAAQAWTLYPPAHPSATAPLDGLQRVLRTATSQRPLRLTVTPDALLIDEVAAERAVPQIAEAAAVLHARDILEITFQPGLSHAELRALLQLLKIEVEEVRARGGPEAFWKQVACPSIQIRQIDYRALLERTSDATSLRRDGLWRTIVRSMRGRGRLDAESQRRLLEISHDAEAVDALIEDVRQPICAADGSPLVSAQGAAVLDTYRRVSDVVGVQAPERIDGAIRTMARVTATLPSSVALEMLSLDEDLRSDGPSLQRRVAAAMDDHALGTLLAQAITTKGTTARLDRVIKLLAQDGSRTEAVLTNARAALQRTHAVEPRRLEELTEALDRLATAANATPYTSNAYRGQLEGAAERAQAMSLTGLPEELEGWLDTVDANSVRRLSVTLLCDLLRLEDQEPRAASLVDELRGIAEDLLLSGDFEAAFDVVEALSEIRSGALGHRAARAALQHIATSSAIQETVGLIGSMTESTFQLFRRTCFELGPVCVESLRTALAADGGLDLRVVDVIAGFGPASIDRLAPLAAQADTDIHIRLAELLGRLGLPEGVPLLDKLLRSLREPVVVEVVRAIARIDDPAGSRVLQTYLRDANTDQRKLVVGALLEQTPKEAVPVLIEILDGCNALGPDHRLAMDTLAVLKQLRDPRAVPGVARAMKVRRWFRRARSRALKTRAVETLLAIRSTGATAALTEASTSGDRMLRRLARPAVRTLSNASAISTS